MENVAVVFISVVVAAAIIMGLAQKPTTIHPTIKENNKKGQRSQESSFKISNYLKIPVKIMNESKLICEIKPKSYVWVEDTKVSAYLRGGDTITVLLENNIIFGNYTIATDYNLTIRELHVGMIVSKWSGADSDYNIGKRGGTAVQGIPYVKIHNETDLILQLNENINLQPNAIGNYSGRDGFGVRLGTVFRDNNGIFDDFIIDKPITDLYFGVVSDLRLPLFGGFQLVDLGEETTRPLIQDSYEPHHLLEVGWMGGGKDHSKIKYGFLPKEGKYHENLDRWGLPRKIKNTIYALETEQDPQQYKATAGLD